MADPRLAPRAPRLLFSRDSDGGNGIPTVTVVAAVAGIVGGVVVVGLVWRLGRRVFRPRAAPLPPPQPLAHHREQQLASHHERKTRAHTWFEDEAGFLGPGSGFASAAGTPSGSSLSLVSKPELRTPSMNELGRFADGGDGEREMAEDGDQRMLPLPNRPFLENRFSATSAGSLASMSSSSIGSHDAGSSAPTSNAASSLGLVSHSGQLSPTTPPSATSSSNPLTTSGQPPSPTATSNSTASHGSPIPNPGHTPRSHSQSQSQSRGRPVSDASFGSYGSAVPRPRVNTIRGPPHSRHSQVQIVLPAPLAPSVYQQYAQYAGDGDRASIEFHSRRLSSTSVTSLTDSWVGNGARHGQGQRNSSLGPFRTPSNSTQRSNRRSHSASFSRVSSDGSPARFAPDAQADLPPVPALPETFRPYSHVDTVDEVDERGRSRSTTVTSRVSQAMSPTSPVAPPAPAEPPARKLHKPRSRSRVSEPGQQQQQQTQRTPEW